MKNTQNIKARFFFFLIIFVMILNTVTYSYADFTTTNDHSFVKSIKIDGKDITVHSQSEIDKYMKEFEKQKEELTKKGYTIVYSNSTVSQPIIIISNSTNPKGNTDGKYMIDEEEWKLVSEEAKFRNSSLFKLENTKTKAVIFAYCLDLVTVAKFGTEYQNEYIENLEYANFKNNEDKIRTIIANSYPAKSLEELRKLEGQSELTAQEAVRATQLLIWKIVHNGEYVETKTMWDDSMTFANKVDFKHVMKFNINNTVVYYPFSGTYSYRLIKSNRNEVHRPSEDRVYKLYTHLDKLGVTESLQNLQAPTLELTNLKLEDILSNSTVKVSYDYKVTGKNSDGSDVASIASYYIDDEQISVDDEISLKGTDSLNKGGTVSFILDANKIKGKTLKVRLSALQSLEITNALLAKTGDRKVSQTLVTTNSTKNNRTVVVEGSITVPQQEKTYSFSIKKLDNQVLQTENTTDITDGLQGAVFEIRDFNNNFVNTMTTDEKGVATVKNLKSGVYTLKETQSPNGYSLLKNEVKVIISDDDTVVAIVDEQVFSSNVGDTTDILIPITNVREDVEPKDPKLKTTVSIDETSATEEAALKIQQTDKELTVVDTIIYENLNPNQKFSVSGTLYKVVDDKPVQEISSKSGVYDSGESGAGQWTVTFENVKLEPDTKYVVFENALEIDPKDSIKPQNPKHEDPKALSQTIVVEPPTPPEEPPTPPEEPPTPPEEPPTPPSEPHIEIEEEDPPRGTSGNEEELEEENIPLGSTIKEEITELEEDVPLGLPKTGTTDDTTIIALVMLALFVVIRRKSNK